MKSSTKGFILPTLIIVIALLALGTVFYYYSSLSTRFSTRHIPVSTSTPSPEPGPTPTSTPAVFKGYENTEFGYRVAFNEARFALIPSEGSFQAGQNLKYQGVKLIPQSRVEKLGK